MPYSISLLTNVLSRRPRPRMTMEAKNLMRLRRSVLSMERGTGFGERPPVVDLQLILSRPLTFSELLSSHFLGRSRMRRGQTTNSSERRSGRPRHSDMSPMELIRESRASLPPTFSSTILKKNHPPSPEPSSTISSQGQSNSRTRGTLTMTINFTCPLCSGVHSHKFRLSSSTKRKISTPSIIKCSNTTSTEALVLLQLVTLGKVSMLFVERFKREWSISKKGSTAKSQTFQSLSDVPRKSLRKLSGETQS